MKYPDFITSLSQKTGMSKRDVRALLDTVPDVLLELQAGERVQTPMGTFGIRYRGKRQILLPDGISTGEVPEQITVQLRPGHRLKVSPGAPQWDYMRGESSSSD